MVKSNIIEKTYQLKNSQFALDISVAKIYNQTAFENTPVSSRG